jgi:hypothetical protein
MPIRGTKIQPITMKFIHIGLSDCSGGYANGQLLTSKNTFGEVFIRTILRVRKGRRPTKDSTRFALSSARLALASAMADVPLCVGQDDTGRPAICRTTGPVSPRTPVIPNYVHRPAPTPSAIPYPKRRLRRDSPSQSFCEEAMNNSRSLAQSAIRCCR